MDYFNILNLSKEPFSNSPDPEFFFHSREHLDCLQKLELSLRLRRGLNVIIGDVGTGKTTLCRQLIRRFSRNSQVDTHLILDPHFQDKTEFLTTVAKIFVGYKPSLGRNEFQLKEEIKKYLFQSGVDQNKTTVLIIDEGQKIPEYCLEILREFLNFETNDYKLLQIVIFAQREFEKTIQAHANFADRINLYHLLGPLNFHDTRSMIKFRLEQSAGSNKKLDLFSFPALVAIYSITKGYPRKIINLCHQSILTMIIQNRTKVSYFLVRACARRVFPAPSRKPRKLLAAAAVTAAAVAIIMAFSIPQRLTELLPREIPELKLDVAQILQKKESPPTPAPDVAAAPGKNSEPPEPVVPETENTDVALPVTENIDASARLTPADLDALLSEKPQKEPPPLEAKVEAPPPASVDEKVLEPVHEQPQPLKSFPQILGQVTLQRNETLSFIIQRVYGSFNSMYFKSLILANPQIEDPDRVEIGLTISLPAIPVRVKPIDQKVWWIQIQQEDTLEAAFDFLRSYPANAPPVRLLPYSDHPEGTKFAVILKKHFLNEASARKHLGQLPPEFSSGGKLISLWDTETVFFANPYAGGS